MAYVHMLLCVSTALYLSLLSRMNHRRRRFWKQHGNALTIMDSVDCNGGNPYLALRAAKIARNEARLLELGLATRRKRKLSPLHNDAKHSNNDKSKKRAHPSPINESSALPLRRSLRTKGKTPSYKEIELSTSQNSHRRSPPTSEPKHTEPRTEQSRTFTPVERQTKSFPFNSARVIDIDINTLVLGTSADDDSEGLLGRPMNKTGKAFVMEESARLAGSGYAGGPLSFNKYSGVQEWANDVLFLWVNLGAPNSDVVNEFLQEGTQVTWFGGSRMHDGSSVIQNLKRVGRHSDLVNSSEGVVLWCRQYSVNLKTFGPYVCFGRLSLVAYDPTSRPLRFVWEMLDASRIHSLPHHDTAQRMITEATYS